MFAEVALTYRRLGYSPLPIVPGTKRPALRTWSDHCKLPLAAARISALSRQMPRAGIGVALGFAGLVGIDVDTEDSAIIAAITAVLLAPAVVKIGARGWTAFYRAPGGAFIPSRRIPGIVDVLGSGTCTVLPPSPHPHGFPYRWGTGETLDRVPVGELPEVPADIADLGAICCGGFRAHPHENASCLRTVRAAARK